MIQSAEEFYKLRTSSDQTEYARAAHEEAPLPIWLEIIKNYPDMGFWVAQNKTVPVEILEILAQNSDAHVRGMVAAKRKLPEKLQLHLAKDPDFSIRERLVYNLKTTKKVLTLLLEDSEPKIREAAKKRLSEQEG